MTRTTTVMRKHFETPFLFGTLCSESLNVDPRLARALTKVNPRAVLLPFQVKRSHLRNVIACMQLMDIRGLVVAPAHQQSLTRFIPRLTPLAKRTGCVDTILRETNHFIGHCVLAEALETYLQERELHIAPRHLTALVRALVTERPFPRSIPEEICSILAPRKQRSNNSLPEVLRRTTHQLTVTFLTAHIPSTR